MTLSDTSDERLSLTEFARKLRHNQTEAEKLFWAKVRAKRFFDLKFKRQVPINKYVVDFLCESRKLIIEIDDASHADKRDYDLARTQELENRGYRVIRFRNDEIYENMDGVLEALWSITHAE